MTVPSTINWTQVQTRPTLMIPGPTELPYPVIQAMNQPPTIQYDRSFDEGVLEPTTLALREVFQTKSEVILLPGSGRTALEAGALSVIEPGDRVLVVGAGQFGVLMREIMNRVGADWTEFPVEWGARLDLDRLEREAERIRPKAISLVHNETSTGTTYPAADVGRIAKSVDALILEEGLAHRFRRHAVAGGAMRRGIAAMGLEMFPDASLLSKTVSCLKTPPAIDPAAVFTRMRDQYGILIGTGLDKMRTSTLRIGTMAMTASPHYVLPTLSALELALRDLGHKGEPGAGVAAAQAAFADAGYTGCGAGSPPS